MRKMMKFMCALAAAVMLTAASAQARTEPVPTFVEITVYPDDVPPDGEQQPRANLGDAPTGWGDSSWQGPATGKSNWHARYQADGDYLSILFPNAAAYLTINDIASISYWTKEDTLGDDNRDWWIQVYTRPQEGDTKWYHNRFTNNYASHSANGEWQLWSTDTGMTFGGLTLDQLKATYGSELIETISLHTDSGWNGFDGYIDGLTITLTDGSVGRVNFAAVPLPAAAWAGMALMGAMGGWAGLKRKMRRD